MKIDWSALADQLGCNSGCGSLCAKEALAEILGEEAVQEAVEHYISGKPGDELARFVLWQIHPWSGMQYCYRIYKTDPNPDRRTTAVELLRVLADRRALPWIQEFLDDPSPGVQLWGARVVDQLLWSELIDPEEVRELLDLMRQHPHDGVRECYEFIQEYLIERSTESPPAQVDE